MAALALRQPLLERVSWGALFAGLAREEPSPAHGQPLAPQRV